MKCHSTASVAVKGILLVLFTATSASALHIRLGEQDFTDGDTTGIVQFNEKSIGEEAPFNGFRGSDSTFGSAFVGTWTFEFPAASYSSGSLTLGIYDHDSQQLGSQIDRFRLDGVDLTGVLHAEFESRGGNSIEYNVYTIAIPPPALQQLSDGVATFSLVLTPPGLRSGSIAPTNGNGAGIDFSTLSLVPEPSSSLLIVPAFVLAYRRRYNF